MLGKVSGSGNSHRIAVYFDKHNPEAEAEVLITITKKSGKKTDYTLIIQRTEKPVTPTPTETFGAWTTVSQATVFAPKIQKRTGSRGTVQTRTVGSKLTPTIKLNVKSIKLKVKQSASAVTVTLKSGKKATISVTVQKTTVKTEKITGLKFKRKVYKSKLHQYQQENNRSKERQLLCILLYTERTLQKSKSNSQIKRFPLKHFHFL